jgi:hypothetical protein
LPLHRVPVQTAYNTKELSAALRHKAGLEGPQEGTLPARPGAPSPTAAIDATQTPPPSPAEDAPPPCPKCGQPMILRQVKRKGPRQGQRFWGCPDFPRCRGVRDYVPPGQPADGEIER